MLNNSQMSTIFFVILILSFSTLISKKLKIPTSIIEIFFGSLFIYLGLIKAGPIFNLISYFGFLFLMFLAGFQVKLYSILNMSKSLMISTIAYFTLLYGITTIIVYILDLNPILIILMNLIAISLLAALAKEYGPDSEWIKISFITGSIGQILSIVLFTIVSSKVVNQEIATFYEDIVSLIIFIVISITVFIVFQKILHLKPNLRYALMPDNSHSELDFRVSITLLFMFLIFASYLHVELPFGTFLAGVLISTFFDHKIELQEKLGSLGFGFLVPIFLISIGKYINYNSLLDINILKLTLMIIVIMMGVRILSSIVFTKLYKKSDVMLMALSQCMPLTLIIALATIVYEVKMINSELFNAIVLASMLEVLITMVLIKFLVKKRVAYEDSIS